MSEKCSENSEMSDAAFAQDVMRGFVESRPGENLKVRLASAATALNWTVSRAKSVLYGGARRIEASEMERLCRAAKVERRVRELADDHHDLAGRLARMEAMLADLMATVEGGEADRTRSLVRAPRSLVGSGAAPSHAGRTANANSGGRGSMSIAAAHPGAPPAPSRGSAAG